MNPNDDYRPYDWLQVLGGFAVGALFGLLTRSIGASTTVAWAVGLLIGVVVSSVMALMFWVERRSILGVEPGHPEQIAQSLGSLSRTYAPINRVPFAAVLGVIVFLLVVVAVRG